MSIVLDKALVPSGIARRSRAKESATMKQNSYIIPLRALPLSAGYDPRNPTFKTGELNGITAGHIRSILSLLPHHPRALSSDGKVTQQWLFEVGGPESFTGYLLSIWDYKGSGVHQRWSTFGPHQYFEVFFGDAYTRFIEHPFELRESELN